MQACGVCHTDLHYREGGINDDFPFLLGHEAAGVVEAVGAGRHGRGAGRLRDPQLAGGVRQCRSCRAGPALVLLRHPQRHAEDDARRRHAAVARARHRRVRREDARRRGAVHARSTRRRRPTAAGLLGCGVMAGLGAAMFTGNVRRGDTVAVFGCGGVGDAAIAGAALAGARARSSPSTSTPASSSGRKTFGATHTVDAVEGRPGRGGPGAHRRQRRRRVHRGRRQPEGVGAGVLRPRPRRHASCRSACRTRRCASTCR